jgi:hypothetical protein
MWHDRWYDIVKDMFSKELERIAIDKGVVSPATKTKNIWKAIDDSYKFLFTGEAVFAENMIDKVMICPDHHWWAKQLKWAQILAIMFARETKVALFQDGVDTGLQKWSGYSTWDNPPVGWPTRASASDSSWGQPQYATPPPPSPGGTSQVPEPGHPTQRSQEQVPPPPQRLQPQLGDVQSVSFEFLLVRLLENSKSSKDAANKLKWLQLVCHFDKLKQDMNESDTKLFKRVAHLLSANLERLSPKVPQAFEEAK